MWSASVAFAIAACSGPMQPSPTLQLFVDIPGVGPTRVNVPRPDLNPPCTPALAAGQTIAERAAALRTIGLFADRASLSDADLGTAITSEISDDWGGQIQSDDPFIELFVADQDGSRVWWADLEADVADGNGVYVDTIQALAAISGASFMPTAVQERWTSDTGPVTVTFDLAAETRSLQPEYLEDWIDPRILVPLNQMISANGRRFETFAAFDQTAFVIAVTEPEKQALISRGWCFD